MCGCKGKCGCNITSTTKGEKGDASPVASLGYKVYKALISQVGTDAPTVVILENTIGAIVWTYSSVGQYIGTLSNSFTVNKTFCLSTLTSGGGDDSIQFTQNPSQDDVIEINTWTGAVLSNDLLYSTPILIEVYP